MEYILLLAMIVAIFGVVLAGLSRLQLDRALLSPINERYRFAYKYGHPDARGLDEGDPRRHPRLPIGQGSFRIFFNPSDTGGSP